MGKFLSGNYTKSKNQGVIKQSHINYGNIKIHNLKCLHWNKGNSLFRYKLNDIFFVLVKYKPNVMSFFRSKL